MKLFQHIVAVICFATSFIASAGDQLGHGAKCAVNPTSNAEVQPLQGTWEGMTVGDQARQKITLKIKGNSLHFYRDANFWFDTTFTLPPGKDPKQLHATIKACPASQADSLGKVVKAFFKIEQSILTLATIGDDAEETTKGFEAAGTRYELRKVE